MDFSYDDDQQAVLALAGQILGDHCTQDALRAVERADGPRFDAALWKKLAEAGLLGTTVPERHGGSDLGFLVTAGVCEHVGATAAAVPLLETVVMAAAPIAKWGSEAQQAQWLPKLADGSAIGTAALAEPHREAADPGTSARADGDGWVLAGSKICVPAGPVADLVLVPAAFEGTSEVGVFLVPTDAPGLSREALETMSGRPESAIELAEVRVGSDALLGTPDQGAAIVAWIELRATAALAATMAGVCREALRLTAEYTKERKQFDQPIATFQAVGQRAADAYIDTEAIRITALQAAWRIDQNLDAATAVASAKYWAAAGGSRVTRAAQHLHGGVGADREYPVHRYYLLARHVELTLGGEHAQLAKLGKLIADAA